MTTPLATYHARMQRVFDHVEAHLDDDLGVDALASVAAFSPCHFHRQFTALFGLPVHRYVQLLRLKRASYRLAFRPGESVTGIALDAGYEAPEAFARAFRRHLGQSPSDFRAAPTWASWRAALEPLDTMRSKHMTTTFTVADAAIVDFPQTRIAAMAHRGDPAALPETIRAFIAWRRAEGLAPARHATFNIFHTAPDAEDYHLDLAVATDRRFDHPDIATAVLPAGRCARLRVTGSGDNLEAPAAFLYREWLPASGEEPRDQPLFARRVAFFPDVPEHEAVTDLFLPLR
jgi:AraC family transcriptional regulator